MKIFVTVAVFVAGCYAALFKFPDPDPCIMVQMNANLTLTMTVTGTNKTLESNGVLDERAEISSGSCDETTFMEVSLQAGSGLQGAVLFNFHKSSDAKVLMDTAFIFTPSVVFKNNDTWLEMITNVKSKTLSKDNASYACAADQEIGFIPFNASVFKYDFKMVISQVQIQAFNIKNGAFSPAEHCTKVDVKTEYPEPTIKPYESTNSQSK